MKYKLPYFKEIETSQIEESYSVDIKIKDQEIGIGLNFKETQAEAELFDKIKSFLENIEQQDSKNRIFIDADFNNENGDTVREYIEFHTEELSLSEFIDYKNKIVSPDKQLIEKLKLVNIGFYPDGKYDSEAFAIFDYTIDREITDQLIVVNIDKNGELLNLAWES